MKIDINRKKTNSMIKNYYRQLFGWEQVSLATELVPYENSLLERVSFSGKSIPKYSMRCSIHVSGIVENNGIRVPISDTVTNDSLSKIVHYSFFDNDSDYDIKGVSFNSGVRFSLLKGRDIPYFGGVNLEVEPKVKEMIR